MAGKGSKQTPDSNSGCLLADKLWEICEKHYNQILPIMAEKVHQEKLQGIQTRLTYGESSRLNSQTQFSESESYDRKKRPKKRRQSPVTAAVSATVFTRLGLGDKNVFTRLGEMKRGVHSRLGPGDAPRHKRVSIKSTSRSAETPSQRRKDARELIRSYVTCSSKRHQEIEEEWNTADRASHMPYTRIEELYYSKNDHDQGGHWNSKKRRSNDEDDLS
nr:reverse transcriptase domain-containing protein [Tanacetum cinerariifolium]